MRHCGRFSAALALCFLCSMALPAPGSGAGTDERSAETLFIDAQKALARDDYDGAEALLMQSLERDPSFVSAVWQLAQIHESRGRLDRAREYLKRGLAMDPRAAWARERLETLDAKLVSSLISEARAGLASGDFEAAGRRIDRARAIDADNPTIGELRAEMERLLHEKRLDRLVKNAERALAETQSEGNAPAREALRSILAEDPQNSWALDELRALDAREAAKPAQVSPPPPQEADETARDSTFAAGPAAVTPPVSSPNAPTPSASVPADPGAGKKAHAAPVRKGIPVAYFLAALAIAAAGVAVFCFRRRRASLSYPLQGSLSLAPMLDLVSMLCANRRTGILGVASDDVGGEIYFASGEIVHARCGDLSGKKAFLRLMEIHSGSFHFHNRLPTARRTITEPLSTLLLSMKRHEEPESPAVTKPPRRETVGARR